MAWDNVIRGRVISHCHFEVGYFSTTAHPKVFYYHLFSFITTLPLSVTKFKQLLKMLNKHLMGFKPTYVEHPPYKSLCKLLLQKQ